MVRAPYIDKNGTKRGSWSEEEDQRLIDYIQKHGHANWRQLPKFAGLTRCGKSCRLRWMNYLRPNLKRGNYTQQEEKTIIELHKKHGNKWSLIAENLAGRTDNEIKNYWHSNLKKFSKFNEDYKLKGKESETTTTKEVVSVESHHILESSLSMSSEVSNNKGNSPSCSSSHAVSISKVNLYREEESVVTWQTIDGFSTNFWTEPFVSDNAFSDQDYFHSSCYQVEAEDPFLLWYW